MIKITSGNSLAVSRIIIWFSWTTPRHKLRGMKTTAPYKKRYTNIHSNIQQRFSDDPDVHRLLRKGRCDIPLGHANTSKHG